MYPILQSAADTYYLEYAAHCVIGSEPLREVRNSLRPYPPARVLAEWANLARRSRPPQERVYIVRLLGYP